MTLLLNNMLKNTRLPTADVALSTMKIMLGMKRIDFMGHVMSCHSPDRILAIQVSPR